MWRALSKTLQYILSEKTSATLKVTLVYGKGNVNMLNM
jgi:hypothetical protein